MPDFAYTARNLTGQKVEGVLSANSEREALATLSGKELFPLQVRATQPVVEGRNRKVKAQLVAKTYDQLSGLLRSGVPLLRAIDVLRRQYSHAGLVAVLDDIHAQVEKGSSLADAMARYPRVFGEMATSIVRAGGEGGFLEDSLQQVADFTEKQQELKGRTLGALVYPIILAVLGVTVVNVLIIFFVPKFEPLFKRLEELNELPAITSWLLGISRAMQTWWPVLVGMAALAFYLFRRWAQTPDGRQRIDDTMLKLPIAGPIVKNFAVSRFCRVLGTLLSNGVPIVRALKISSDATGNRVLSGAIQDAADNISAGESLASPLIASKRFPTDVVEMIAVAEESNTLETVLKDIAETLDRQTWRRLDLGVRMIEPLMLVVLAAVVLMFVIALVLPMLKMSMTV